MLDEVRKYFTAVEAAEELRADEIEAAHSAYMTTEGSWPTREALYTAWRHAVNDGYKVREEALAAARKELETSGDPLVRFIAKAPLRSYPEEAGTVLKALPATYEDLNALAAREEWCDVWELHVRRAAKEGAITLPAVSPSRAALDEWAETNLGRSSRGELAKLVDAAVRAEVVAALGLADAGDGEHHYLSTGCLHGDLVLWDGRTGHQYCQAETGAYAAKTPSSCDHCGSRCVCACHTA